MPAQWGADHVWPKSAPALRPVQPPSRLARALVSALTLSAPAAGLEISVSSVEIGPNATAEAQVLAKDAKGIAVLQMRLSFDGGAFAVENVRPGPILANALLDFLPGDGVCAIAFAAAEPIADDGVLFVVSLRRKPGADKGSEVQPVEIKAWTDSGATPPQISVRAGSIPPLAPHAGATRN